MERMTGSRALTRSVTVKLAIPSNLELDKVLSQLRVLKHVVKVVRQ